MVVRRVRQRRLHLLPWLVGSHVDLKTDAVGADPVAYCAGEPSVSHVQALLVGSLPVDTHEFVSTPLALIGALEAFRVPATAVCSVGLQHLRCDFQILEYGLDLIFMALFLASSLSLTFGEFTVES